MNCAMKKILSIILTVVPYIAMAQTDDNALLQIAQQDSTGTVTVAS